jgi:hypothetical protein
MPHFEDAKQSPWSEYIPHKAATLRDFLLLERLFRVEKPMLGRSVWDAWQENERAKPWNLANITPPPLYTWFSTLLGGE